MKVTCTQENLQRAFSFLERVTGKQTNLPILANFLLQPEKGRIKLSATNLEIGVTAFVSAKIEGVGEIVAPAKILHTFIGNLPGSEVVEMNIEGSVIRAESGGHSMKIRGFDVKDFPIIPQQKGDTVFSFPAQELKTALQRLVPCVSQGESRLELTGVNFMFSEAGVRIAATDSFRLGEQMLEIPENLRGDGYGEFIAEHPGFILPFLTIQEIIGAVSPETEEVRVAFEENQVFFEIGGVEIVSRIINGKYPDYQQILPTGFSYAARVNREDFLRAVRMSGVFASRAGGETVLTLDPGKNEVTISSQSSDIGENRTVVSGDVSGDAPIQASFNPRYLLDGINVMDTEEVVFRMNTPSSPAGIGTGSEKEDGFTYIIMPIRK